ncbi:ATP-binding protein [Nocardioides humilatus]|uniref:ATP-binding protein n=1 Tax=Nocardioides humilatus TaxID=2607660 RepID=UPI00165FBF6D|nr:adenylate/guanylate cyclase domain-containing protein [Nocardioides humilatus]
MGELPSGTVTFAFVDVVGSTSAFTDHGDAFVAALDILHRVIADCTGAQAGVVVKTEGDGAFLAFPDADGAVRALVALQDRVEATVADPATPEPRLRVRAGAHTGAATPVSGDYVALPVNVAARVTSAAGAGQALISEAVVEALSDAALAGPAVGEYALKDVRGPTSLYRVTGPPDAPRAAPYRRTNVAETVTSFVGRDAELIALGDLVRSHRLVTVLGPGGMGKTRLTSELVLRIASSYDSGAWLVELASVSEPEQVLSQFAAAVGSRASSADELADELVGRGRMLLLVDNCEHVIDAAAEVAGQLLARVPHLSVLATSREALMVEGERVWRIPALAVEDAGCALFAHRYADGTAEFERLDRSVVAELCRALDGSPLAIELASSHAHSLPIDQLLAVVRDGSETLARRGGGRQSSLDAVVAWSIDRLDRVHREALLVLAQAPARLTSEEAALLLRDLVPDHATTAVAVLRHLVSVSLVDLDGDRYRLLDTIRAAARRALRADDQLRPRARRMLHAAAAALVDPDHDFSLIYQDDPRADRLLLLEEAVVDAWEDRTPGLGEVWVTLGIVAVYLPLSERLRRTASAAVAEVPDAVAIGSDDAYRIAGAYQIAAMADLGAVSWSAEDSVRFVEAVAAGSPPQVGTRVAMIAATVLVHASRAEGAVPIVERAVGLAELTGEVIHRANAAVLEAFVAAMRGDHERALALSDRAREIAGPDYADWPAMENNHACNLVVAGRPDEAIAVLRRALDRHPWTKDRWGLTTSLAEALLAAGEPADAAIIAEQVREELVKEPMHGPARQFLSLVDGLIPQIEEALLRSAE